MGLTSTTRHASTQRAQRGSVLLFSLIVLLLIFLGALFTLRGVLTDTGLTDRFSERQKNIQASDLALQWIVSQIGTYGTTQPLEVSAQGQPWFLGVQPANAVTPGVAPNASYWSTCMSAATSTDTCAQATLPTSATQTAWVFVQPTGRTDTTACNTLGLTAIYYDIWVHTIDARQQVATDTEAVYKLCIS